MAFVIADRVRETTTTTGTGNISLAGAVSKFRTFASVLSNSDTTYYSIVEQSGTDWEVGIGTFTAPSTLARTTILSSANGGAAVNFAAGTKDVFITLPASKTNVEDQPNLIEVNSASDALRITQTGAGNALVVEDSANPDATPFVVNASGNVGIGTSSPGTTRLYISANRATDPTLQVWDTFNGASFENSALLSYDGTKTFFYNFQANPLAFGTNNAERMRIDSSGNVGIGTSSPGNKLDIVSAGSSQIRVKDGVNATAYYDFGRDGTDGFFGFSGAQTTFSGYKFSVNAGTEVLRITNGGNVGIGTSSAAGKLHTVLSTSYSPGTSWSSSTAAFGGSTSTSGAFGIAYDDTNGAALASIIPGSSWKPIYTNCSDFIIKTGGTTEAMRITSGGNVGIGTSSPGQRLVIQGSTTNVIAQIRNSSTVASTSKTTAVQFIGTDTVGTAKETGDIYVTPADNDYVGSQMLFFTRGSDTVTERLRIASAGQIGIGGANYGTSGQVLTSNGSGAAPSWQAAGGGGTGTLKNVQVFTSSGTYTRTSGVTTAVVIAVGGGGGGSQQNGTVGGAGGTTSFGSHVSAAGGGGGSGTIAGAGGTGGTGATIAIKGAPGGLGEYNGNGCTNTSSGGSGGGQGGGAPVGITGGTTAGNAGVRGGGGSGPGRLGFSGGGGQGETCIKYTTTVGATETVTIGAGGTSGGSPAGGAGGAGYIIVYEYS